VTGAEMTFNPADLARKFLEDYYRDGRLPKMTGQFMPEYKVKAGAFVSLKKGNQLRGCIGTVEPVRENLAAEIAANAVAAAERDPRFAPITPAELQELCISVDVLSPMERIKSKSELDPSKYGVMVRSGPRSGLLLPDLEGIDSVEEQLAIAMQKAGIKPGEPVELYRFTVSRYRESGR
jgi:AmmeMemoRadiSam system protein A